MNYYGTPMADFLAMIKDRKTTELLDMMEGDGKLTVMQLRALEAEVNSRRI